MHTTADLNLQLQAILADPDDDGARLVYADLLEEEGERERDRAVLIRDQIQKGWKLDATGGPCVWSIFGWAGFPGGEPSLACWRGANWFLSLDLPKEFRIARGFVESITLPAADFLRHADALLASHPIAEVRLTTWPEVTVDNWKWPEITVSNRPGASNLLVGLAGRSKREVITVDMMVRQTWEQMRQDVIRNLLRAEFPSVRDWHLPGDALG